MLKKEMFKDFILVQRDVIISNYLLGLVEFRKICGMDDVDLKEEAISIPVITLEILESCFMGSGDINVLNWLRYSVSSHPSVDENSFLASLILSPTTTENGAVRRYGRLTNVSLISLTEEHINGMLNISGEVRDMLLANFRRDKMGQHAFMNYAPIQQTQYQNPHWVYSANQQTISVDKIEAVFELLTGVKVEAAIEDVVNGRYDVFDKSTDALIFLSQHPNVAAYPSLSALLRSFHSYVQLKGTINAMQQQNNAMYSGMSTVRLHPQS